MALSSFFCFQINFLQTNRYWSVQVTNLKLNQINIKIPCYCLLQFITINNIYCPRYRKENSRKFKLNAVHTLLVPLVTLCLNLFIVVAKFSTCQKTHLMQPLDFLLHLLLNQKFVMALKLLLAYNVPSTMLAVK